MRVLLTGAGGFIGAALAERLLARGDRVHGIDNLNAYYDVSLKAARLARLENQRGFTFRRADISSRDDMGDIFAGERFDIVVHLAAQAGVRYSVENPAAYVDANLVGFGNVLEGCRRGQVSHLVFASSSSVYGANRRLPYSEHDNVDHPLSFYGATKKANELMAHCYAHLYGIPCTGLRFFTVYGPWGRPDMALFRFARAILEDEAIPIFNHGQLVRDFTYIDDIVTGIVSVIDQPAGPSPSWDPKAPDPASSDAPYRIYNIGNSKPVQLMRYIEVIEKCLGREARKSYLPKQREDLLETHADVTDLSNSFGYRPATPVEVGVAQFVEWFKEYYGYSNGEGAG